jgi:hypothetical protein
VAQGIQLTRLRNIISNTGSLKYSPNMIKNIIFSLIQETLKKVLKENRSKCYKRGKTPFAQKEKSILRKQDAFFFSSKLNANFTKHT